MDKAHIESIREVILRALSFAETRHFEVAVKGFSLARTMAAELIGPAQLRKAVASERGPLVREQEAHRAQIRKKSGSGRPIVIIADSLGLPRIDKFETPEYTDACTYPSLLAKAFPDRSVEAVCERYFTTSEVLETLRDEATLGCESDVIIHVGLNDTANRMYLLQERLALGLLPADIRDAIVGFSKMHRREIIKRLPSHHYVSRDSFRANLDAIAENLQTRKATRVILATTILPPEKFWGATPNINRNFAGYNLEIMEAVARHGFHLLDFDRLVWAAQGNGVLLPDGMHLTNKGHVLFAEKCRVILEAGSAR